MLLDRRAGNELDERFALRLDRFGRGQQVLERKLDFVAEAFGTFVQHQLTLVAHQPGFSPETAQLGQKRYRMFVEAVGRRLAHNDQPALQQVIAPKQLDAEQAVER